MTRIGHWDTDFGRFDYLTDDTVKFSATLDVQSLVSDFMDGLREKEDAVLEPILVDWLRGRGWTVERD